MTGYSFSTPVWDGRTWVRPAVAEVAVARTANGPEDRPREQDAPAKWDKIGWRAHEGQVRRLRQRIFKASREQDWAKVRNLQKLMLRSRPNTLVSVRQGTQRNAGRKTPGIDGEVALTSRARADIAVRVHQSIRTWKPRAVKRVYIPKAGDKKKLRPLGIPVILDRCHQNRVKNALEPEWEARFEARSYGFRPGRGCHDAIAAIYNVCKGPMASRVWALDADLAAAFDRIDHDRLLAAIGSFPARDMISGWLKAGVFEAGKGFAPTGEGTPQGGVVSPPTQWITWAMITLRIGFGVMPAGAGGAVSASGDAVPDGDLLGSDEDVLDQEPEHSLAFEDAGGGGCAIQLGEEASEVAGELEVGVLVGDLGVEGADLAAQVRLPGAQVRHPGAQLVDGDQLLGVGLDQGGDRGGGLGQGEFQLRALPGDRVAGAGLLEPLADLGADQVRAGEQAGDVVPDHGVEVVGADRLVMADPAALVAVVVRAQAPVVVDRLVRGAGGGPVVAVPARLAGGQALEQGGDLGVAGGVALVVGQPLLGPVEGVAADDGGDGDLGPFLAAPLHGLGGPRHRAALQAAARFSPGDSCTTMVLPKTAVPA